MTTQQATLMTKTVTAGVGGTRIRTDMYEAFRDAILDALPTAPDSLTLSKLSRELAVRLSHISFNAKGSVTWYMMAVKLDLEARGQIERVHNSRPQRLRRT